MTSRTATDSLICALVLVACASAVAGEPEWRILKPSNTGVPGELIHGVRWAPNGDLWVAARWPFWEEGGLGVLDLDANAWSVWSNWETPIPSEYINDIEFDQNDTAWIATDSGLVRFDGETWTVFDPTNTPMQLYRVRDIAVAPDGHIWVNNSDSSGGGDAIYDFDGESIWIDYRVPDDLPWEAPWTDLSHVFVASSGHVWVANNVLPGVAEYDGETWTLRGEERGRLDEMAEDQFGNIWINAHGVGGDDAFFRWDGASFTRYPFDSPTTLRSDPDTGTIYVGNWGGEVVRTSDGGQTIETYLTGLNQVFSIAPDPNGSDVWIGTIGAVGHFRNNGEWVRDFNSYNSGLPWYWVDNMTTDRDGFFWVATGEAGLSRFDGQRWRNWGNHNAGSEPYPFAGNEPMGTAYQDSSGVHWFGGNGIARWHSETNEFDGFWNWENNPGMGVGLWTYFAEDDAGNLFSAEEHGTIYRFDPDVNLWVTEAISPYAPLGLPGMHADGDGNVWVAAWFDIHKWDGSAWSTVELPYDDYFFDLGGMTRFSIDVDGVFWIGTSEGLVRWDGEAFTLYDTSNSPLPFPNVRGIDVRDDGLVGLSAYGETGDGAAIMIDGDVDDPTSWNVYTYGSSPLPHWQVDAVAFDANGDLWISALSEGVAVLLTGPSATPPDLNGDGVVNVVDLLILLDEWGECPEGCLADLNGDGMVGVLDLLVLLEAWS
jgi:ligand-binding sensor domain-containing protein